MSLKDLTHLAFAVNSILMCHGASASAGEMTAIVEMEVKHVELMQIMCPLFNVDDEEEDGILSFLKLKQWILLKIGFWDAYVFLPVEEFGGHEPIYYISLSRSLVLLARWWTQGTGLHWVLLLFFSLFSFYVLASLRSVQGLIIWRVREIIMLSIIFIGELCGRRVYQVLSPSHMLNIVLMDKEKRQK